MLVFNILFVTAPQHFYLIERKNGQKLIDRFNVCYYMSIPCFFFCHTLLTIPVGWPILFIFSFVHLVKSAFLLIWWFSHGNSSSLSSISWCWRFLVVFYLDAINVTATSIGYYSKFNSEIPLMQLCYGNRRKKELAFIRFSGNCFAIRYHGVRS